MDDQNPSKSIKIPHQWEHQLKYSRILVAFCRLSSRARAHAEVAVVGGEVCNGEDLAGTAAGDLALVSHVFEVKAQLVGVPFEDS